MESALNFGNRCVTIVTDKLDSEEKNIAVYLPVLLWGIVMFVNSELEQPMQREAEKLHSVVCLQECLLLCILLHPAFYECKLPTVLLFVSSGYKFILSLLHHDFVVKGPCRELHIFASILVLVFLPRYWFHDWSSTRKRPVIFIAATGLCLLLQSGVFEIADSFMVGIAYQFILIFDLLSSAKFFFNCLNASCELQVLAMFTMYQVLNSYVWIHFLDLIPDMTRLHSVSTLRDQEGFIEEVAANIAIIIFLFAASSVIASFMNTVMGKVK